MYSVYLLPENFDGEVAVTRGTRGVFDCDDLVFGASEVFARVARYLLFASTYEPSYRQTYYVLREQLLATVVPFYTEKYGDDLVLYARCAADVRAITSSSKVVVTSVVFPAAVVQQMSLLAYGNPYSLYARSILNRSVLVSSVDCDVEFANVKEFADYLLTMHPELYSYGEGSSVIQKFAEDSAFYLEVARFAQPVVDLPEGFVDAVQDKLAFRGYQYLDLFKYEWREAVAAYLGEYAPVSKLSVAPFIAVSEKRIDSLKVVLNPYNDAFIDASGKESLMHYLQTCILPYMKLPQVFDSWLLMRSSASSDASAHARALVGKYADVLWPDDRHLYDSTDCDCESIVDDQESHTSGQLQPVAALAEVSGDFDDGSPRLKVPRHLAYLLGIYVDLFDIQELPSHLYDDRGYPKLVEGWLPDSRLLHSIHIAYGNTTTVIQDLLVSWVSQVVIPLYPYRGFVGSIDILDMSSVFHLFGKDPRKLTDKQIAVLARVAPLLPGFAYTALIRPDRMLYVMRIIGPWPTFTELCDCPREYLLSQADMVAVRVYDHLCYVSYGAVTSRLVFPNRFHVKSASHETIGDLVSIDSLMNKILRHGTSVNMRVGVRRYFPYGYSRTSSAVITPATDGYCYLVLFDPNKWEMVRHELGPYPLLSAILSAPVHMFAAPDVLARARFKRVWQGMLHVELSPRGNDVASYRPLALVECYQPFIRPGSIAYLTATEFSGSLTSSDYAAPFFMNDQVGQNVFCGGLNAVVGLTISITANGFFVIGLLIWFWIRHRRNKAGGMGFRR